ncbi:hypothetical protein ACFY1P_33830 [Streptomyces sp. NPDC001407]|uniref:hypothetical protein n=1 Tax=Streptomyces sp. NPDC001407 TaxID=3364573 RepID=UPI0036C8A9D2
MAITSAMPAAKERPRRTRTKRASSRPALKLSQLPPSHIDLRQPLKAVLVCKDCGTWCPITGMQSKVQKLVPHHTGKAGVAAAIHCRGSNRRIEWDMTITEWRQALADADKETSSRRPTNVLRKPKVAPAPAVSQIAAQKQTATTDDEPGDGRPLWLLREMKWASTESAVRETDTRRAQLPAGDAPLGGLQVPLTTLHPQRPAR